MTYPRYATSFLYSIAIAGVLFQIGHFAEHAAQAAMWLLGDRSQPWMSVFADDLVRWVMQWSGPIIEICTGNGIQPSREMQVGMEVLHLIGNGIFLATITSIYLLHPSTLVRYALYVEGFHLVEHLMLTLSTIILEKPFGFSTLFGYVGSILTPENAAGYRVMWHFTMNFVPSALLMTALMRTRDGLRTPAKA